jgi:Spy/CpxP family protein refolding chaperone
MKKKHLIIALSLTLVAAVSLTSCGRHRHAGRHDPEMLLKRMDAKVRKLDLTEAQLAEYSDFRARLRADLARDFSEMGRVPDLIMQELNRDNPDIPALAESLKSDSTHLPVFDGKYLDYFVEFYNILDEEQQKDLHEEMRKKINRRRRRHSRKWS